MNIENLPVCEHGIPALALSNWRDGDQTASEAEHIAAHLAECETSRARLADYDALVQALRAQHVPPADERLWEAVHMRINQTRIGAPTLTGSMSRRLLSPLAALAAVLALLLSFVLLLTTGTGSHSTVVTPAPATATPTPIITVSGWSQIALPAGLTLAGYSESELAIAPSDGDTAYACVVAEDANQLPRPGLSANQIWVTHDRGAHWHRMTDLPGPPINLCSLQVDALNPAIVLAWGSSVPLYSTLPVGTPPVLMGNVGDEFLAVSFDGGVTWQQPAGDTGIQGFATSGGTTYAARCCSSVPSSGLRLMVSRDGMRSWTPVDAAIVAAGQGMYNFFYRPDTGEILATALGVNNLDQSLWESGDGGHHWSELPSPTTGYFDFYVTQQPTRGQPWHLCAETFKPAHSASAIHGLPTGIVCSEDGGHHWTSRALPAAPPPGFTLLGITNGGDLLAESGGAGVDRLYRLPTGSNQWQMFDTAPGAGVSTTFVPSPGGGVLWAVPVPPSFYSPFDPGGRIYTKDYTS